MESERANLFLNEGYWFIFQLRGDTRIISGLLTNLKGKI